MLLNTMTLNFFLVHLIPNAIYCAIALILFQNSIYSIFSLIIIAIISAIVLISIKVEFLAYIFLIVYVGAVAVLFLFIIMMLNLKVNQKLSINLSTWELYVLIFLVPKFIIVNKIIIDTNFTNYIGQYNILPRSQNTLSNLYDITLGGNVNILSDIDILGNLLYTDFLFLFLISGIILLVSMIGALILTTNKNLTI